MRQQKIIKREQKPGVTKIDNRTPKLIDPAIANAPVRAVNFVEVRDMDPRQVQLMIQKLNSIHDTAVGGIHYFIPIRNGKIGSDILFEKEFLDVVEKVCEIKDGKIVLKDGAKEVIVIREKV